MAFLRPEREIDPESRGATIAIAAGQQGGLMMNDLAAILLGGVLFALLIFYVPVCAKV